MKVIDTAIPEVKIFEPRVFRDSRGSFFESFNSKIFTQAVGHEVFFLQDNHSVSVKNVLRGLHFQKPPHAQGKLVRVVQGEVFDVAVDLRRDSHFFGQWVGVTLSSDNKRQLWIPEGFAHGFLTISQEAQFLYKATNFYAPESEETIMWNDPHLNIEWPIEAGSKPSVSEKDERGKSFSEFMSFLTP